MFLKSNNNSVKAADVLETTPSFNFTLKSAVSIGLTTGVSTCHSFSPAADPSLASSLGCSDLFCNG